jgi:hypothetical protein
MQLTNYEIKRMVEGATEAVRHVGDALFEIAQAMRDVEDIRGERQSDASEKMLSTVFDHFKKNTDRRLDEGNTTDPK